MCIEPQDASLDSRDGHSIAITVNLVKPYYQKALFWETGVMTPIVIHSLLSGAVLQGTLEKLPMVQQEFIISPFIQYPLQN